MRDVVLYDDLSFFVGRKFYQESGLRATIKGIFTISNTGR